MKTPETTEVGKALLAGLDFHDYTDDINRALHEWHAAGEHWNDLMHRSRYIASGRSRERANNKIIQERRRCVCLFEAAARLIVADSPIEERAVSALHGALREEDDHRLDLIDTWYKTFGIAPASDESVRDIAMAFADPAGHTLMHDSDEPILSRQAALELYEARLKQNELSIFHKPLTETPETTAETAFRYGTQALGMAWSAARGLKSLRKRS